MARKSRRSQSTTEQSMVLVTKRKKSEQLLRAGAYGRLSVENGGDETDESLQTQMAMLYDYIEKHPDLKLEDSYSDNGYSGTNFDRPDFVRLMDDVRSGRIQCIVVKDLSRFGRNYLETGYYLETLLPHLNVRFIAVTDDFDSSREEDRNSLSVPIKNMVNDLYAKDISRKISAAAEMRRKRADALPFGTAPYGYRFSEDRKSYLVDEETAPYVRMIFLWGAMGLSSAAIAKRLALLDIITPGQNRSQQTGNDVQPSMWRSDMVYKVFRNPNYLGDVHNGRLKQSLHKSEQVRWTKPEEWSVHHNTHTPLVTREDYEKAHETLAGNYRKSGADGQLFEEWFDGKDYFPQMVYCADCGKRMSFNRFTHDYVTNKKSVSCYVCSPKKGEALCGGRTVYDDFIKIVVMDQIHVLIKGMCERKKLLDKVKTANGGKNALLSAQKKMMALNVKIAETEERQATLYEDYAVGLLDMEDYLTIKERYISEVQTMQEEMSQLEQRKRALERTINQFESIVKHLEQYLDSRDFNEELVHELVERISFSKENGIEITFKCDDVYQEVIQLTEGETNG